MNHNRSRWQAVWAPGPKPTRRAVLRYRTFIRFVRGLSYRIRYGRRVISLKRREVAQLVYAHYKKRKYLRLWPLKKSANKNFLRTRRRYINYSNVKKLNAAALRSRTISVFRRLVLLQLFAGIDARIFRKKKWSAPSLGILNYTVRSLVKNKVEMFRWRVAPIWRLIYSRAGARSDFYGMWRAY